MEGLSIGNEKSHNPEEIKTKYNQWIHPERFLTEEERLIILVNRVLSDPLDSDLDRLAIYYKEKVTRLKVIFDQYLSSFATFQLPVTGLGVEIQLNSEISLGSLLPIVIGLGLYHPKQNIISHLSLPITKIRLGFGTTPLELYTAFFLTLKTYFDLMECGIVTSQINT